MGEGMEGGEGWRMGGKNKETVIGNRERYTVNVTVGNRH